MFSVLNGFFLRPMPFPDDGLVMIYASAPKMGLDDAGTDAEELDGAPADQADTCTGRAKAAIDAASAADVEIPLSARSAKWGSTNDGTLNRGAFWLPVDIVTLYSSLRCWKSAAEVIERIEQREPRELARGRLAIGHARAGHVEFARAMSKRLDSDRGSGIDVAHAIAAALVEQRRIDAARSVLASAYPSAAFTGQVSLELMRAMVRYDQLDDAVALLDSGTTVWNWSDQDVLAHAYLDRGDQEGAFARVAIARRRDGDVPQLSAPIYSRAGRFQEAFELAMNVEQPLDRLQVLANVAEAAIEAGEAPVADAVFAVLRETMNELSDSDRGSGCTFLAKAHANVGNLDGVHETIRTHCQSYTLAYDEALIALANHDHVEEAKSLRGVVSEQAIAGGRVDGPIAVALARRGEFAAALQLLGTMGHGIVWQDAIRRVAAMNPSGATIRELMREATTPDDRAPGPVVEASAVQALAAAAARNGIENDAQAWIAAVEDSEIKARGYVGLAQGLLGIVPGRGSPTGD